MSKNILEKNFQINNIHKIYDTLYNWEVISDMFHGKTIVKFKKNKYFKKFSILNYKLRFLLTKKASIPFFSYFLTTQCSLNCKECCVFKNRYKKENHVKPVNFEDFKRNLDITLNAVDKIHVFQLTGGEPLLTKDIAKIVEYVGTKKQIKNKFLTTNCTIMPSDSLLAALKKSNFSVQISSYKNASGVSQYYDKIKNLLIQNRIRYSGWLENHGSEFCEVQKIYSDPDHSNTFSNCFSSKCTTLCDGKIFLCPAALFVYRNITTETGYNEIINLKASENIRADFINLFSKDVYDICSYCHFPEKLVISAAGEQE